MREIKFRAWDKENNWMLDLDESSIKDRELLIVAAIDGEAQLVPMQYTGLKTADTNLEIYEGDILEHRTMKDPNKEPLRHIVAYETNSLRGESGFSLPKPLHKFEVIGNIYENPELLDK